MPRVSKRSTDTDNPQGLHSYLMAQHIELWPIENLVPYARNPRTHSDAQVEQIAASIAAFGFNNPILVDTSAGIIAGHGRLLAGRKLGLKEVPVIVLDHLSESQKCAYIIADNQLALNAGWDQETLRAELAALDAEDFNLNVVGFEEEELARLLAAQDATEGLADEDAVPELPSEPVSRVSDLFLLGDHKLLVGDAILTTDVERLMAGDAADMVFTDLPYNCGYEGYTKDKLTIKNDDMSPEQFDHFLRVSFTSFRTVVKPEASLYICHSSAFQREFQNAIEAAGFEVRCQIIWAKNTFAWGFARYKFRHEPTFYCHVSGQKDPWYGDKSQSTLWEENKPSANRLHPTMKPVELIERALLNSSKAGDIVADLFGGSGSTLVASERRNRKSRLMEIDPKYADVVVRRYQEYTGKPATLDGNGRKFDEIAQERDQEIA
ncbi:MAG TPA: site-specific DNA-methyltransferase [Bryobacteraceae bacterium]|jgi:DNA modification methylase|nr:site-specific DNA-methyltransferase [Bryobacteraceae bacterium]